MQKNFSLLNKIYLYFVKHKFFGFILLIATFYLLFSLLTGLNNIKELSPEMISPTMKEFIHSYSSSECVEDSEEVLKKYMKRLILKK